MKNMTVTPKLSVLAHHIKTLGILTSYEFILLPLIWLPENVILSNNFSLLSELSTVINDK